MGNSHCFLDQNHFLIVFLPFAPWEHTKNLPLLKTQNRPTLVHINDNNSNKNTYYFNSLMTEL